MLNDIRDAQKLKSVVSRAFEGKDGEMFMQYLEILGNYNSPITDPTEEGARRIVLTIKSILMLTPEDILNKGR